MSVAIRIPGLKELKGDGFEFWSFGTILVRLLFQVPERRVSVPLDLYVRRSQSICLLVHAAVNANTHNWQAPDVSFRLSTPSHRILAKERIGCRPSCPPTMRYASRIEGLLYRH